MLSAVAVCCLILGLSVPPVSHGWGRIGGHARGWEVRYAFFTGDRRSPIFAGSPQGEDVIQSMLRWPGSTPHSVQTRAFSWWIAPAC